MLVGDIFLGIFSVLLLVCLFLIQMEKKSYVRSLAFSHPEKKWKRIFVGAHILFLITNAIFIYSFTKDPFSVIELQAPRFFHGFVHAISLQALAGLFNLMMLMLIVRVHEMSRLRKKNSK